MVDTVIRLFESTATEFTTNGLGVLSSAIKCEVVEERNGEFELTMEYPIDGNRYSELALRRLIVAKPNPFDDPQPFRIYSITKPMNGRVTVAAEHISYDLSGYVVRPFTANSPSAALSAMEHGCTPNCPFTLSTDKTTNATMTVTVPTSFRSLLGGMEGSVLDVYGPGEYEFDNYNIHFWASRGQNRGVNIRYGKNLTDLEQEENCAAVYTHVFPYWYSDEDGLVTLDEMVVPVPGTFDFTKIKALDLTGDFDEVPSKQALKTAAQEYVSNNRLGVPKVSLNVSFIQLAQSEEYKYYRLLEAVRLCDTVTVEFPKLGVSATSKCIKTTYNVITGKYISLELGEPRTNLVSTIESQNAELEVARNTIEAQSSVFKREIDHATKLITGGLGGYVVLHSSSGGNTPDEILILGPESGGVIDDAVNVWRWNSAGLGFSNSGYDGPFETAITYDGRIVADFITAGTLRGMHIVGGTLDMGGTMADGSFGNGTINVYDAGDNLIGKWDKDGLFVESRINVAGAASSYFKSPFNQDGSAYVELSNNGFSFVSPRAKMEDYTGRVGSVMSDYGLKFTNTVVSDVGEVYNFISPIQYYMHEEFSDTNENFTFRVDSTEGLELRKWTQRNGLRAISLFLNNSGVRFDVASFYIDGELSVNGNLSVSGTKPRLVTTEDYAKRLLYCYETPSPYFGDIGEGVIGEDGLCYVGIDPMFAQTVNLSKYQVFIQAYSENAIYVIERNNGFFVVKGTPGDNFAWEIKAKQGDFDQLRLDKPNEFVDIDNSLDYGQEAIKHLIEIKEERAA